MKIHLTFENTFWHFSCKTGRQKNGAWVPGTHFMHIMVQADVINYALSLYRCEIAFLEVLLSQKVNDIVTTAVYRKLRFICYEDHGNEEHLKHCPHNVLR